MIDIERLKELSIKNGYISKINDLRSKIKGSFDSCIRNDKFATLESCINKSEEYLADMREVLKALQEVDPEHK